MTRTDKKDTEQAEANDLTEQASDGEPILKKYAGAVHIGADLTLYQRRAFNCLLFWAMPEMPQTTRHEIGLEELAWGMGLERASQRMQRLVENLDKMMGARVVWNLLDDKGDIEEWESTTLLPSVKVSRRTRTVTYEFTRAFQERVYNPSEFAEIALRMQRAFRSEHALALYENTRRFLLAGETPWIPIDTFRTLMGVNDKPYYDEYKYLSARLIKPAMKQVNECSDIQLLLKTRRVSRAIADLKFLVSKNPQMTLFAESLVHEPRSISTEDEQKLMLRLSGYRIIGKRAEQLIEAHGAEDIFAALSAADAWMENKEKRRQTISNPAGVAFKAITEGWRLPEPAPSGSLPENTSSVAREKAEREATRLETLRDQFTRAWYRDYIAARTESELAALRSGFEDALSAGENNQVVLARLRKRGLTGIALALFQSHLASQGIMPSEHDFDTYLRSQREPTRNPSSQQ